MAHSLGSQLKTGELSDEDETGRFLLLIPGEDFNQILGRVESIKQALMTAFEADSLITEATSICLGVCELSGRLDDSAQAIEKADQAWQQSLISKSTQQIGIIRSKQKAQNPDSEFEHQVVNAIKERRLKLLFQPMVGLKTDIGECYHGLVRLENEDGEVIPAGQFLPIAEKLGVHKKLDQWVFFKSLAMIANRKRLGQPVNLMINQSPWVFGHSKWVEWVQEQILKREVDPQNVIVEFKLPSVMRQRSAAIDTFDRLMDIGVQLSLGQFTATDSAFELIDDLPVHYIKLHSAASLLEMTDEPVSAIVARLHERGQKVIIPGIEDAATAAIMWTSGADYLEGNFIQEPDFRLDFEFSQHR
jgi:EAL domain-containing protein (putative c-di-GMP-specific phosphodiesterase class I)